MLRGDSGTIIRGSDILTGGEDDDFLMGGIGADTFIFSTNGGSNTIASFDVIGVLCDATNGYTVAATGADFQVDVDHAQLEGFSSVNVSSVMSFVSDGSDGAVFSAAGTTITFFGVSASQLSSDDFIFV